MAVVPGAAPLTDERAGAVLSAALEAAGTPLRSWRLRDVHRRERSIAVVYEASITGVDHDVLLVAHASRSAVPTGAARLDVDGGVVHVWRFPHDPYLPGLPPAVSPEQVGSLLDDLGVRPGTVRIRTRSYRPTRRAVVEIAIRRDDGPRRVLYLKVLGGRTRGRVRDRAEALAGVHRALYDADLPVPPVIGTAVSQGLVVLGALPGRTLRRCVLDGDGIPEAADLVALSRRLAAVRVGTSADPRRFADARRHVPVLTEAVPDLDWLPALAAEADEVGGPAGTVHGDLHDGQVLVRQGRVVGLLDLDGVGTGLRAHDAGRLVAYVESAGLVRPAAAGRTRGLAAQLVAAYRDDVPLDDLRRAVAGAWISLATSPVRSRGPDWQGDVRARLDRARAWLAGEEGIVG